MNFYVFFLNNKLRDLEFVLVFYIFGSVNYDEVFQQIPEISDKKINFVGLNLYFLDIICVLLFVGASDRMEMEKIPAAGYSIKGLWISGFQRSFSF